MAFGGILGPWRLERAARHYARTLGPQLVRDFGAAETYNTRQIRRAAERAGLAVEFLALGYAAFLTADAFRDAVGPERAGEYEALRALFVKHQDVGLRSASGDPGSDYATGPYDPPHTPPD